MIATDTNTTLLSLSGDELKIKGTAISDIETERRK
jgi:hypothetical protein